MPHGLVVRARMILACAEGLSNAAVAAKVGASPQAVGKWRRRFLERGVEGLHDELRPGRPRTYDDEKVAAVISRALQEKPDEWRATIKMRTQRQSSSVTGPGPASTWKKHEHEGYDGMRKIMSGREVGRRVIGVAPCGANP